MTGSVSEIWALGSDHVGAKLLALQVIDLSLTTVHSLQERKGLLWRYFGAIAGVKIPDTFGLVAFFGVLTVSLWIVGFLGIAFAVFWQTPLCFVFLGGLIGSRLSDSVFSHLLLNNVGFRPNPGLPSVPLYLAEAVVLLVVFYPAILLHLSAAATGFTISALFFYSIVPVLKFAGPFFFDTITPWRQGEPQPAWVEAR